MGVGNIGDDGQRKVTLSLRPECSGIGDTESLEEDRRTSKLGNGQWKGPGVRISGHCSLGTRKMAAGAQRAQTEVGKWRMQMRWAEARRGQVTWDSVLCAGEFLSHISKYLSVPTLTVSGHHFTYNFSSDLQTNHTK